MFQSIIVYFVILAVVIYTLYSVIKNLRKKENSPCGDCNGCEIKREITKNMKDYHPNKCEFPQNQLH
jgi:hypothetical protein